MSVVHVDASAKGWLAELAEGAPFALFPVETVLVDGPEMTKVPKSSLIWQMLEFCLQILNLQKSVVKLVGVSK